MTPTPQAQVTEEMRKAILACVPSTWVDNLLTGKDAPELPWNCPQIEQLLNGVRKRLESALSAPPAREIMDESGFAVGGIATPPARQDVGVMAEIVAERNRQIEQEGWTEKHDDDHSNGEIGLAAACYAASPHRMFCAEVYAGRGYEPYTTYKDAWPWHDNWWKPKDRRRDLVRAGALIIAEIERLDRAAQALDRVRGAGEKK